MTSQIHPTAIIEDGAQIGNNVKIGAYSLIGANVNLADDIVIESHVVVTGQTKIGEATHIFPFASIGHRPQDLKFQGEITHLTIGARNQIREYVTMQPGTKDGGGHTIIGDDGLYMASAHVAHDCKIGNHVILANNVMIAGHCEVSDHVIFGGGAAAHQFVRIGDHAFVGAMTGCEHDLIPYGMAKGNRASLHGLNLVGLKRRGFKREDIQAIRKAYNLIFFDEQGTLKERTEATKADFFENQSVMLMIDFILSRSDRSLCVPG